MLSGYEDLLDFFNKKEFVNSVEYTAGRTGFSSQLIEKDYLCSIVLNYLYSTPDCPLIFKGGTLLAKVHTGFYRLSEDLDFALSVPKSYTRKQRSNTIKPIKDLLNNVPEQLPCFNINVLLSGRNESQQYNMELGYVSKLSNQEDKILIDIGLREEVKMEPVALPARTLLLDPFLNTQHVQNYMIRGLSLLEAYAEKIRAALTREKLAIRDFYDLDYAIKRKIIDFSDPKLINLVKDKISHENLNIAFVNNNAIDLLKPKIPSELIRTLQFNNTQEFDLQECLSSLLAAFKILFE